MCVVAAHIEGLLQRKAAVVSAAQELRKLRRALQARNVLQQQQAAAIRTHGNLQHVVQMLYAKCREPRACIRVACAGRTAKKHLRLQAQHGSNQLAPRLRQRHVAPQSLRMRVISAVYIERTLLIIHRQSNVCIMAQAFRHAAGAAVDFNCTRALRVLALHVVGVHTAQRNCLAKHSATRQVNSHVSALLQEHRSRVCAGCELGTSYGVRVGCGDYNLY